MKEERRRVRELDRRNRLKLLIRAVETVEGTGDTKAAVAAVTDDTRSVAPLGKVKAGNDGAMDRRNDVEKGRVRSSRDTRDYRKWSRRSPLLWRPPKLSAVEATAAKTAYVPTISKSQQVTVRQWLSSLHIHLVDGEGGFVLGAVHAMDAQAVKAMRSVPTIPLAEDRMRNGDLYGQLLCVLEPDLAIHANIPRLLLGFGGVATIELCLQNLERVCWLIRLRMCPPIPLVYLCQPREFLSGNRDLMWGLAWEMMQLYSTPGGEGGSNPYPSRASLDFSIGNAPIPRTESQLLPYSPSSRRQLDLSILNWLDECGLLREIGGDLCRPSTLLSLESYLRDGTLLCLLVERRFLSGTLSLSSRVHSQWHWHRHPTTRNQCLLNMRSSLSVLRSCRHMSSRFLYSGVEDCILGGRWDCILGLLEDMHRCADGLQGTAADAETPYLGKFPPIVRTPAAGSSPPDRTRGDDGVLDLGGSFDHTLRRNNFVVSGDDIATYQHMKTVDKLGGLHLNHSVDPPRSSADLIHDARSSFDLFPSIAAETMDEVKEEDCNHHPHSHLSSYEHMYDDDDAPRKFRDRQLTNLDPTLSYSGLALPALITGTFNERSAMNKPLSMPQQLQQIEDQDLVNQNDDDPADVVNGLLPRDTVEMSPDSLGSPLEEDSLQAGYHHNDNVVVEETLAVSQPATGNDDAARVSNISLAILRFRQKKLLRWLQEEGVSPLPRPGAGSLLPVDTFSDGVLLCDLVRRIERCGPLPGTHHSPSCSTHRIQNVRRCLEFLAERNKRIPLRELSCEEGVLRGDMDRTLDLFFSIRKGYRGRKNR